MNITIKFSTFELAEVTNFTFSRQIWVFEPNLQKQGISDVAVNIK